ncbi:MAG: YifB family Mg chelatase-like AAA ATPase [Acidobacteria bacterium]|nr:YifB family Mg chelatase-like AAA ATPase [Acidobacteriota bacterium]
MFSVLSVTVLGIEAYPIDVEVDVSQGFFAFNIVGLPDTAVRESRDRIITAMKNCGHYLPRGAVTVNLAPADLRKEGTAFDLPIALGILGASGEIHRDSIKDYTILGELSLNGAVKPVKGVINAAIAARDKQLKGLIIPRANAMEAAVVDSLNIIPVTSLPEAARFLSGEIEIPPFEVDIKQVFSTPDITENNFTDIRGQEHAKRAMEVAAAGGHNIMMLGPPGSGKTLLARGLPGILPTLTLEEAIETTRIHSIAGLLNKNGQSGLVSERPYRSPHHTISNAGLVGGGVNPMPGEVSISHNGILFLDELPEFQRNVLEVLRQPLEDGIVTISRAKSSISYPARFMLVAAMNPCPCGWYNSSQKECTCSVGQIQRYRAKISGPLLDRIDIHIEVPAINYRDLTDERKGETSEVIRSRVEQARRMQVRRFTGTKIYKNSEMSPRMTEKFCRLDEECKKLLEAAMNKFGFTARAYHRILKVARTIADLEASTGIEIAHLAEAIQYRSMDRAEWTL